VPIYEHPSVNQLSMLFSGASGHSNELRSIFRLRAKNAPV
jgi:hypothetical protein